MTECEWLQCDDILAMIRHLGDTYARRPAVLFGLHCCHAVADLIDDPRLLAALRSVEEVVDGDCLVPLAIQDEAWAYFQDERERYPLTGPRHYAALALKQLFFLEADANMGAVYCCGKARGLEAAWKQYDQGLRTEQIEYTCRDVHQQFERTQIPVLRDIVGNPFRPPPTIEVTWRTTNVMALAQAMESAKCYQHMPILGDALLDAGCEDTAVIDHCHRATPHVRGCWLIDTLLGKR